MRKFVVFALIAAIVAAVFGAITPGQAGLAQPGTTLWAIQTAMQGGTGTRLFALGEHTVLFAAARPDGEWVLAGIQAVYDEAAANEWLFTRMTAGKGTVINAKDMAEFERALMERGWRIIAPAQVPASITATIEFIKMSAMLRVAMGGLTTFLAVPLVTLESLEDLPWNMEVDPILS